MKCSPAIAHIRASSSYAANNRTEAERTVNGVACGVGLAGVGIGAILFTSSGKGVSKAALAPLVLPGGGGASRTGRF